MLPAFNIKILHDGTCIVNGNLICRDAESLWRAVHATPKTEHKGSKESVTDYLARGGKVTRTNTKGKRELQPADKKAILGNLLSRFNPAMLANLGTESE